MSAGVLTCIDVHFIIIHREYVFIYVCMYVVVCYATSPIRFASRALNFHAFIYDPTVGLSLF